jgi:hypothetical protein
MCKSKMSSSSSSSSIEMSLKYRPDSNVYDNYDELYAMEMKRHFSKLSINAQNEFNLFTDNLMVEKFINNNKLMDAIKDFKKTEYFINIDNDFALPAFAWNVFDNESFNYRPWQPCVIS